MNINLNEVIEEQNAIKSDMTTEDWERFLAIPYPDSLNIEDFTSAKKN